MSGSAKWVTCMSVMPLSILIRAKFFPDCTIVHLPHFGPIIQKSFMQYFCFSIKKLFFLACSKLHLVLPTTELGLSGVFSQKIDNSTVHKSKKAACDGDLYYGLPVDTVTHLFGGERRTSINLRPLQSSTGLI